MLHVIPVLFRFGAWNTWTLVPVLFQGMKYLHTSPVESHGALRSSCCVIDSRWVLKVGSVGLHWLRHSDDDDDDHTVADDQSEGLS